ncbi:sphingosine hydroxylase [Irpex rosettiformis]|uniref:Sphingosine hydroxylase n=1 Tax=Irpex rosettiformis TaxID=378272 RepID=A0ACB8UCS4_9APHY|nr:sphingosine hydroxylase [Irpex rosettiformis]
MNGTITGWSLFSASQQHYLTTARPFYYIGSTSILDWMADNYLSLASPIIAYWTASLFFHLLDISDARWLDKYRIHDSAEVKSRNLASRWDVFIAVIFQHFVQTLVGLWWMEDKPVGDAVDHLSALAGRAPTFLNLLRAVAGPKLAAQFWADHGHELVYAVYWWAIPAAKFLLGMFIIDTWEYFLHRAMHNNTYLYKTFHSVHHRLYVPYAFGALYNHPLEGFLLDSVGAGLAETIAQMSTREATLLFVISTLKTVDDHCGYSFPWDPLQMMSSNNADYHDIHHQIIGIKSNFAQPFFIHWDVLLGTRMTRQDIEVRRRKNTQKTE